MKKLQAIVPKPVINTPIKITLVGPTLSCQAPAATTIKAEKNPPIP